MRLSTLWLWPIFLVGIGSPTSAAIRPPGEKPNIVLILVDDLGARDLGCYGSRFHLTPHIDRLAADGLRFTDAYAAAPICSPTRASLLTGRHPARLHLTDWLPGRGDRPGQRMARPAIQPHLPLTETTLAESLQRAGYISASIGKWHLGGDGFSPTNQGFARNVAGNQSGSPPGYFSPYKGGRGPVPGLTNGPRGESLTDRLTQEAENFILENKDRPFFLYFSHFAVHIPLAARQDSVEQFTQRIRSTDPQTNATYAAMLQEVDESVGKLRQLLTSLGLSQNTILIFTSDNGGLSVLEGPLTPATSNAPLRAGKGYLYEGGIRVPLLLVWPGKAEAGGVRAQPVISMDLFHTLHQVVSLAVDDVIRDGQSLLPLLASDAPWSRTNLFWHYPHYSNQGGKPGGALRSGRWKFLEFAEDNRVELYDLTDPSETNNLANQMPDKVAFFRQQLAAWRQEVGAQTMTTNLNYDPVQDISPAGPEVVRPASDGSIVLHARDVAIHGSRVRYEPQPHKNTIGYWTVVDDWVSWDFMVTNASRFEVEILQGCGPGSGGSEVLFSVGDQSLPVTVQETRGFQDFIPRPIGIVELKPGRHQLSVKPKSKPGVAVMDLRMVTLRRVGK